MFVCSPRATADNHPMHISCRNFSDVIGGCSDKLKFQIVTPNDRDLIE